RGVRGFQELRVASVGDVEEEDVVLALEHAQEPATREYSLVDRRVAMMRLVTDVARRWEGHGLEHLAVVGRVAIEIDDRKKVGRHAGLIARPDVERGRLLRASTVPGVAVRRDLGRQGRRVRGFRGRRW